MSAAKIVYKLLETEDPKDFLERAFTFDAAELKQRLISELGLGSVVIHTVQNQSSSVNLHVYSAKEPVSQDKWDRANRIAGNEDGEISRVVYDWIESKGGLLLDREYLVCNKHYKKFAEYRHIRFMFGLPDKAARVIGDDNDRNV